MYTYVSGQCIASMFRVSEQGEREYSVLAVVNGAVGAGAMYELLAVRRKEDKRDESL
jgi:hypothetical protein